MKKEWEAPVVLEVNALPEALGVCYDGTTGNVAACSDGNFYATGACTGGYYPGTICGTGIGGG